MSISQLFPEEGPTLNLNFAGSRTLDPRITFTRTSTGTYMGPDGLIKVAPANSPRFDHRYVNGEIESLGLLVEEQRSNLITYSEDFDTWTKPGTPAGASISQDVTISPDGSNTADKIVESNTTGGHGIWLGFTLPQTTTYTFSVFLKADERTWVDVRAYNSTNGNQFIAKIDLENGDFLENTGGTVSLDPFSNGWWRFSGVCSFDNIYTQFFIAPIISNNDASDTSYTGDGSSGIYVWGAQLEVGAFPTSYIPTTNSTATRNPDNVSMVGENFSDWYNPSEFSLFANFKIDAPQQSFDTFVTIDDGTISAKITFYRGNLDSRIRLFSHNMGGIVGTSNVESGLDSINKSAYAIAPNNTSIFLNGNLEVTNTVASNPIVSGSNTIRFGCDAGNGATSNTGRFILSKLSYYPRRLSNSQLQNLTK